MCDARISAEVCLLQKHMNPCVDDAAACQLKAELQHALRRAHRLKRPILTHLNADTTWVVSFPYPEHATPPPGRVRFNLLIDPWLQGTQQDVAGWFSKQWHSVESSVQTMAELEDVLREAEHLERDGNEEYHDSNQSTPAVRGRSHVDAVAVSHEFTDHCHRDTLLELDAAVPIFATKRAARLIQSWGYFENVVEVGNFSKSTDWRTTSVSPLPAWIGISRLVATFDILSFHSALVICIQSSNSSTKGEAIVYTPHGVGVSTVSVLTEVTPSLEILALLHGLQDVSIGWASQLNLGVVNGVKAQRILDAKYWVGTHDEDKPRSGFVAPLLKRKLVSISDASAQLSKRVKDGSPCEPRQLLCCELGNGESLLLE